MRMREIKRWHAMRFRFVPRTEEGHREMEKLTRAAMADLRPDATEAEIVAMIDDATSCEEWIGGYDLNGVEQEYQVAIFDCPTPDGWPGMVHLSIKRRDREPIRDWRVMQAIKNAIVGPEHEGMEMYPAESRRVDGANQYHLWVLADSSTQFPFGFTSRHVSYEHPVGEGEQREETI